MKIFKLTSEDLKFWKNVNLLDGQRRGEVVFRRAFVLIAGALVIYLGLLAFVGRKDQNIEPAKAVEEVEEVEEWVEGDRITYKEDGIIEIVPAEVFMDSPVTFMKKFTQTYRGSRIDDKYFALLNENCSNEALRTVIAISVAETGMGRDVNRQSNFFGWFKNGNVNYDPSQEVMAKEICEGVEKSYLNIGNDMGKVKKYVGYISNDWLYNYRWAYAQMEVK